MESEISPLTIQIQDAVKKVQVAAESNLKIWGGIIWAAVIILLLIPIPLSQFGGAESYQKVLTELLFLFYFPVALFGILLILSSQASLKKASRGLEALPRAKRIIQLSSTPFLLLAVAGFIGYPLAIFAAAFQDANSPELIYLGSVSVITLLYLYFGLRLQKYLVEAAFGHTNAWRGIKNVLVFLSLPPLLSIGGVFGAMASVAKLVDARTVSSFAGQLEPIKLTLAHDLTQEPPKSVLSASISSPYLSNLCIPPVNRGEQSNIRRIGADVIRVTYPTIKIGCTGVNTYFNNSTSGVGTWSAQVPLEPGLRKIEFVYGNGSTFTLNLEQTSDRTRLSDTPAENGTSTLYVSEARLNKLTFQIARETTGKSSIEWNSGGARSACIQTRMAWQNSVYTAIKNYYSRVLGAASSRSMVLDSLNYSSHASTLDFSDSRGLKEIFETYAGAGSTKRWVRLTPSKNPEYLYAWEEQEDTHDFINELLTKGTFEFSIPIVTYTSDGSPTEAVTSISETIPVVDCDETGERIHDRFTSYLILTTENQDLKLNVYIE